jgi:hypothetical protein
VQLITTDIRPTGIMITSTVSYVTNLVNLGDKLISVFYSGSKDGYMKAGLISK